MFEYTHLLNQPYLWGKSDCFTLLRRFYNEGFGLEIPDYKRPESVSSPLLAQMFIAGADENGFEHTDVKPIGISPGDLILMAIKSATINHCGIYVGEGLILHHLTNKFSIAEMYRGSYRRYTCSILRHPEVYNHYLVDAPKVSIIDYYPEQIRRRLLETVEPQDS